MPTKYLPTTDSGLRLWATAFGEQISLSPDAYGLTAADAAHYLTLAGEFAEAVDVCATPSLCTKVSPLIKRQKRAALVAQTRQLVATINGHKSVTAVQRAELGLTVRAQPMRRGVPTERPTVRVKGVEGTIVSLQIGSATSGRQRPAHTIGATLFYAVGEQFPADERQWRFAGNFSRCNIRYEFPEAVPPGTRVWFAARWMNPRLQAGPMGTPRMTYLGGASRITTSRAA